MLIKLLYVPLTNKLNMIQRKGRTLGITVKELLDSKRFEIAISNFKDDPMFMKAILIELGGECINVARNTIIKNYNSYSSLCQFEMSPFLRSIDTFDTFNIWWGLSPLEQKLYSVDPKNILSIDERSKLLAKLKLEFMGE